MLSTKHSCDVDFLKENKHMGLIMTSAEIRSRSPSPQPLQRKISGSSISSTSSSHEEKIQTYWFVPIQRTNSDETDQLRNISFDLKLQHVKLLKQAIEDKFQGQQFQTALSISNREDYAELTVKANTDLVINICEFVAKNPHLTSYVNFTAISRTTDK